MFFADDLVAAVALVASKFPNISSNFVHHLYEIYEMYEKLYNKLFSHFDWLSPMIY